MSNGNMFIYAAKFLTDHTDRQPTVLWVVDAGGVRYQGALERALEIYKIPHVSYHLRHANKFEEGDIKTTTGLSGYRPVEAVVDDATDSKSKVIPLERIKARNVRHAVVLDAEIDEGHSAAGAVNFALEAAPEIGYNKVWLVVAKARGNLAHHYAADTGPGNPEELRRMLRRLGPQKYAEFESKGLISFIADPSQIKKDLQEAYANSLPLQMRLKKLPLLFL